MFKIDNKGACNITNLQCSLCCSVSATGTTGNYSGTGFFGPGFPNYGTTTPDTMSINDAISLLRQPATYHPTVFGAGIQSVSDPSAIIIGNHSSGDGTVSCGRHSIAIGFMAGQLNTSSCYLCVGNRAGYEGSSGSMSIAIGDHAAYSNQNNYAVAIGPSSGYSDQQYSSIAIGSHAGTTTQNESAVAIGTYAGSDTQGSGSIAIGLNAGTTLQEQDAIAIGNNAGSTSQGQGSVAVGIGSGLTSQGPSSVAIGDNAGSYIQGLSSVAIGSVAGTSNQGTHCVAIGHLAGSVNQGDYAVALGYNAGSTGQATNSIIINASGTQVDNATSNSCVITPIRNENGDTSTQMFYNSVTGELTWGTSVPSSIKYKTNITSLSKDVIDSVLKLNSVEFDYKDSGKHSIGLIAEDVEQILPTIVQRHPVTKEIESVEYHQLILPLLELVKKHEETINRLEETLNRFEEMI
jgi:hypothetical protein